LQEILPTRVHSLYGIYGDVDSPPIGGDRVQAQSYDGKTQITTIPVYLIMFI